MTLYLIGLGLGDEKDVTVRGLELIKRADLVFLEHYTSILGIGVERLEEFYGRKIVLADRDLVEKNIEKEILLPAKNKDVCLLVVGDPFGATTHTDLLLRARELDVAVEVVHNASILNAVGVVGLELYKYGKTTSIPYWDDGFEPETPYDVIKENKDRGLHTLCLLDIKVKEPTKEELRTESTTGTPAPRFMTIKEGLEILLQIEKRRNNDVLDEESLVIGVARLGQREQVIKTGTIREIQAFDFGGPLQSIIVPGDLQVVEEEALRLH